MDCKGINVLIRLCENDYSPYVNGSKIIVRNTLEINDDGNIKYCLVNIESINSTFLALPNKGSNDKNGLLIIHPPTNWGSILVERTYTY